MNATMPTVTELLARVHEHGAELIPTNTPYVRIYPPTPLPDDLLGEMLKAQREAGGMNTGTKGQLSGSDSSGNRTVRAPENTAPKLSDMGISKSMCGARRDSTLRSWLA